MKRETLIWTIILVAAGAWLLVRATTGRGMSKAYVEVVEREFVDVAPAGADEPEWIEVGTDDAEGIDLSRYPPEQRIRWEQYEPAEPREYAAAEAADPAQDQFRLSSWRSFGLWLAAFFTLSIFSFLYRDNAFYKIAEAVVVGVSAAYWMVVGFHEVIVPNLAGKIDPEFVKSFAMPGLEESRNLWYLIPLALGVMLLWRLMPIGAWISRWPLAFFIGVFCGLRLVQYLHADFLNQIRNAIVPLAVWEGGTFDVWESLRHVLLVGGVLAALVYFFFSVEHKGVVGKTARVGIWVLMITFGAGFGYTVMGRIALLAIRLEFLFDDWLWLIDPTAKRMGM